MSRTGKSIEAESRSLAKAKGVEKKWAVTANGYWVSFWSDENFLKLTVVMTV